MRGYLRGAGGWAEGGSSRSILDPMEALDIVRAWATALGSNLELRDGDGGLIAKGLFSSLVSSCGGAVVLILLPCESKRDRRPGSSSGRAWRWEVRLADEYVLS